LALLAAPPPEVLHNDQGAPAAVHVLAWGEAAGCATSYLVETAEGVIAVDPPQGARDAEAARAKLAALRKPLVAVLLTHADPGSALQLSPPGVEPPPVLTVAKDRETVVLAGARFAAHELGARGGAWVLLGKRPAAFVGELVVRGCAPDLRQGGTAEWLSQLERARKLFYGLHTFYPGHGEPGHFGVLEEQRRYLVAVRAAVAAVAQGRATLDEAARAQLLPRLSALRPGEPLGTLAGAGADAVARELIREQGP
jgi:glyoxylase-like metal-dependent hydrolase (beta-lactamase superfamily II)